MGMISNMYVPQKSIKSFIDDYVSIIFQHDLYADADKSSQHDIKYMAYTLIPNIKPCPLTNRVVAAGVVYHAFLLCDSHISHRIISMVSEHSIRIKYISIRSISIAARYVHTHAVRKKF